MKFLFIPIFFFISIHLFGQQKIFIKASKIDTSFLSSRINLKLNIIDTANIRLRPIAGTNTSITGTYPNLTFNATATPIDTSSLSNRIDLKLNITDTANIRLRPIAGTNTSITGTYPNLTFNATSGGSTLVIQTHTSGTTVTINNSTTWLIINPSSVLAAVTVTMPATPADGQLIDISFGGTLTTTNAPVVTNLLIVANTGQGLIGTGTYGEVVTEDHLGYRYNQTLTKWFRN